MTGAELARPGAVDSPVVDTYMLLGRIRARQGDADGARVAHEHALAVQLPVRHADDDQEGVEELLAEAGRLETTGIDFGMLPRRMKAMSWRFRTAEKLAGALSAREVEVLRLLAGPWSLRDIGRDALHLP
jgi:hypothetical protein